MPMLGGKTSGFKSIEHQADATLSQSNPVSGTKYTVLATSKNVRFYQATVKVTWTGQPTPLELHGTVDAQSLTWTQANPVSTTNYYVYGFNAGNAPTTQNLNTFNFVDPHTFILDGRSVKLEAETTGGTVTNLSSRVIYGKW